MTTQNDNEHAKLKCVYKRESMPLSTWHYGFTQDNVKVPYNWYWQWPNTCHNSLCESNLYKEAVEKFNDFVASLAHEFSGVGNPVWWFRGQANAKWPILPGALRDDFIQSIYYQLPVVFLGKEHTKKQIYYEKLLISSFIREGSGMIKERLNSEDWYIKAQHHGLPTRLLDWTMNPQVALWMALDNIAQSDQDGVIIAIIPQVHKEKKEIIEKWDRKRLTRLFEYLSKRPESTSLGQEYSDLFENEAILPFSPNLYSPRQTNQQSVFTLHTPPPVDSKLASHVGIDDFFVCREFIVEADLKELYKTYLHVHSMRRWNIYPDLDNLAKGLRDAHVLVPGNKMKIRDLFIGN